MAAKFPHLASQKRNKFQFDRFYYLCTGAHYIANWEEYENTPIIVLKDLMAKTRSSTNKGYLNNMEVAFLKAGARLKGYDKF